MVNFSAIANEDRVKYDSKTNLEGLVWKWIWNISDTDIDPCFPYCTAGDPQDQLKKKSNFKICRIQSKNKGRFDNLIKLKLPPTLTHFIFLASSPSKEKISLFSIDRYNFYAEHRDERYQNSEVSQIGILLSVASEK